MLQFENVLMSDAWFSDLPDQVRLALSDQARLCRLRDGEALYARGEAFDGLYCLVEGSIRISCSTVDGSVGILAFIEPSQWFGEVGLFDRRSRAHDAIAEGPCQVLHLPGQVLDTLLADDPGMWRHFGLLMANKMRQVFVGLEAYALMPSYVWVARRLLMIARQSGKVDPSQESNVIIPVSQDQLAQMLCKTRQTTNKILRKLEADKVLRCGYRHIEILDWDGLWQAAELHRM